MKFSVILTTVEAALQTWAATYKGDAEVAGDAAHAFAILAAKPAGVRAIVWIGSETKRGEHEEASVVDCSLNVIITRGKSLKLRLGDTHVSTTGGNHPLIDLVEEARDVVRGISLPTDETEVTLDYKGFEYLADTEGPIDGYQLNFSIGNLMGAPSDTPASGGLIGKGLYAGLGQVLNNTDDTPALIPAGAEVYDEMSAYSDGIFTAPVSGSYLVEIAYISVESDLAWSLQIFGLDGIGAIAEARNSDRYKHLITMVRLAAGQRIQPMVFHEDAGESHSFGAPSIEPTESTFFKVHRIT